jgi:Ca2+-binding RTX toxin-like protein
MTGSWGNDNLNGGAEFDYADYLNAAGSVTVSLLAGTATGADGNDILSGIEGLYGSQYGDTLSGDNAASNALFGNGGADALFGNGGADYIDGGGGDDTLDGGAGDDNLVGGSGLDWVSYYGSTAAVYVDMSGASAFANGTATGFDLLSGIERAYGSIYGDYLFGSALADSLFGDMGSDVIYGFGLGDSLDGGGDTDYIVGGIGADTITTGAGQDYIYFQGQNEGKDTITDWRTDGFDILVIDEPAFGAGLITGQYLSSESWRFVAGTAATGAFGQFLWNGATSTLSWDADGTGAGLAVQLVTLTGITTLAASDILVL